MSIGPTDTLVMVRSPSSRTAGAPPRVTSPVYVMVIFHLGGVGSSPSGETVRSAPSPRPASQRGDRAWSGRRRSARRRRLADGQRMVECRCGRSTIGGPRRSAPVTISRSSRSANASGQSAGGTRRPRSTWCTSTSRSRAHGTAAADWPRGGQVERPGLGRHRGGRVGEPLVRRAHVLDLLAQRSARAGLDVRRRGPSGDGVGGGLHAGAGPGQQIGVARRRCGRRGSARAHGPAGQQRRSGERRLVQSPPRCGATVRWRGPRRSVSTSGSTV